jgi:hypothetical protein
VALGDAGSCWRVDTAASQADARTRNTERRHQRFDDDACTLNCLRGLKHAAQSSAYNSNIALLSALAVDGVMQMAT